MSKLAINGGTPVRTTPLPSAMAGATLISGDELLELADVVREKSPFRFYGLGNPTKVDTFEKMVCEKLGVKYALAVSSGTAAIACAVTALGLGVNDEVIIPAFSWFSDYSALVTLGILPVFADIGEDMNLDPEDFEKKITPNTKAVICVHYQGTPCRMDEILAIAKKHNILVIEDVAQAFGGSYKGKRLGTMGDIAIASFQTHKIITSGEGGMVMTNNRDYYIRAIRYHDLGFVRPNFEYAIQNQEDMDDKYMFAGLQYRMSELQGAFLVAQFRRIDRILDICRKHKGRLCSFMKENYPQYKLRDEDGDCGILFGFLMNSKEDAEHLREIMSAEGIACGATSACCNLMKEYPIVNRMMANPANPPFGPGFNGEHVVYDWKNDCLNCDKIWERFFCISIGPSFTDADIDDVIEALKKCLPMV